MEIPLKQQLQRLLKFPLFVPLRRNLHDFAIKYAKKYLHVCIHFHKHIILSFNDSKLTGSEEIKYFQTLGNHTSSPGEILFWKLIKINQSQWSQLRPCLQRNLPELKYVQVIQPWSEGSGAYKLMRIFIRCTSRWQSGLSSFSVNFLEMPVVNSHHCLSILHERTSNLILCLMYLSKVFIQKQNCNFLQLPLLFISVTLSLAVFFTQFVACLISCENLHFT